MVVIGPSYPWYHHCHDEYWKIENWNHYSNSRLRNELRSRNYKVTSSANNTRLLQAVSRYQRGLLSYHVCSIKELKTFCSRRGIQMPTDGHTSKNELVAMLEDADEAFQFSRFLDLPPELRLQVFELHCSSFQSLIQPVQPPITRASRLLRHEALPIFYSTCLFLLRDTGNKKKGEFFKDAAKGHINLIRHLAIEFFESRGDQMVRRVIWDQGNIEFQHREPYIQKFSSDRKPSELAKMIGRRMQGIEGRPGTRCLTSEDAAEIERAIKQYQRHGTLRMR